MAFICVRNRMKMSKYIKINAMLGIFLSFLLSPKLIYAQSWIKLGFVAGITGMASDMDVNMRDGVLYAVEKINKFGGIAGRNVQLIIKDDKRNRDVAKKVDLELVNDHVVAIIGHSTSSMTIAGKSVADSSGKLLISPTAASEDLFGKKDFVVCVNASLREETARLAKVARLKLHIRKMACFYDTSNRSYTENYLTWFATFFNKYGGEIVKKVAFNSQKMDEFWKIVSDLHLKGAKGVLIVAAPLHSAILVQKIRNCKENPEIFCVSWSLTSTLLKQGGKAIDKVWFCSDFNPECKKDTYIEFSRGYKERYGKEPDLISLLGYETVLILREAIERSNGNTDNLIKYIPGEYDGLQSRFTIDEYGDAHRNWYLLRVKNGKFVTLMSIDN